jgi:hypothetical protein
MKKIPTKIECPKCNQRYEIEIGDKPVDVHCSVCGADFVAEHIEEPLSEPVTAPVAAPISKPVLQSKPSTTPKKFSRPSLMNSGKPIGFPKLGNSGSPGKYALFYDVRIVLGFLKDGGLIKTATAAGIYIGCLLIAIFCVHTYIQSFKILGSASGFTGGLGALLWVFMFPYACYLAISAAFVRAGEIRKIPAGEFAVSPILAILILLPAEILFILCAVSSLPVALLTWSSVHSLAMSFDMPIRSGPLSGGLAFILMWVIGYLFYLTARWLQEILFVLPSIARNVDQIQTRLSEQSTQP